VTKAEVISIISDKTGVDKAVTSITVEAFFKTVKVSFASGEASYVCKRFWKFCKQKKSREKGT
jgi:DNA-binding protein HU-beta